MHCCNMRQSYPCPNSYVAFLHRYALAWYRVATQGLANATLRQPAQRYAG